jgi:DNA (cytosine-5)-methyltransferase 1
MDLKGKKKVLSLFSGCGGMDLGLEGNFQVHKASINEYLHPNWIQKQINEHFVQLSPTPFETVFANDILSSAKMAWVPFFQKRGRNPEVFHSESIVDMVKKAKEGAFAFPPDIDIVTGGFPCQDFSIAGKRLGFQSHKSHNGCDISDPTTENRGMLYMWMKEVIELTKPKIFIAENVKGLASLGEVRKIIENDFRSIDENGYYVLPSRVLNAADYGVPQGRERIIFIGLNKKYLRPAILAMIENGTLDESVNPYPSPTHACTPLNKSNLLKPYMTVSQAFENLQEPAQSSDPSQQVYSKAKFFPKTQGNTEVNLQGISPTIRAEHHGNIEFRRLSEENGGKNFDELKKGLQERRLTVRECARLQTFPDNYEFVKNKKEAYPLSASSAYKVIGNAVPPLLAYNLAKRIEKVWDDLFLKN